MATYFLNGKNLSDFGILPSRSTEHHLAITGGFDLPGRIGITYYDWPLENSVQPFVNAEDIKFGGREIIFSGAILGHIKNNVQALENYVNTLPELFSLSCKWGSWNVKFKQGIQIIPVSRNDSKVEIIFSEPLPDLSGSLPLPAGQKDIDGYSWEDFSLCLEKIIGGQNIGSFKALEVTQNPGQILFSRGGHEKTEITVYANFLCHSFEEFDNKRKSLYALFGGPGLHKVRYREIEYTCFAVDGFSVTNIRIGDMVTAKFQCKLIVTNKIVL